MRDFDAKPYSADEARIAKFFADRGVGGGDDPVGFILSSYEMLIADRKQLTDQLDRLHSAIKHESDCVEAAKAEIKRLTDEDADHDRSFDLRWKADMRAIKRWQEAHPGNDLVWPDHADLCVWLMEQLDAHQG